MSGRRTAGEETGLNDKKLPIVFDTGLSVLYISVFKAILQICSKLLKVCIWGDRAFWGMEREPACREEDTSVPSFLSRRI